MAGVSRRQRELRRVQEDYPGWRIWLSQQDGRWHAMRDGDDGQFVQVRGTRQMFSLVADDLPTLEDRLVGQAVIGLELFEAVRDE